MNENGHRVILASLELADDERTPAMAEDRMALLEMLRTSTADDDPDFPREGVRVLAQAAMQAEVSEVTGLPKVQILRGGSHAIQSGCRGTTRSPRAARRRFGADGGEHEQRERGA